MTTLQNERLEIRHFFNETFINEARIIIRDVMTNNGVVHVIDQVLKPKSGKRDLCLLQLKIKINRLHEHDSFMRITIIFNGIRRCKISTINLTFVLTFESNEIPCN